MELFPKETKNTGSAIKNCRYCPLYGQSCDGNASDCLCLRCPRNLGQCIKVRYCRETESILDFSDTPDLLSEEDLRRQMDSYFRQME